jgi:hypothetical protein
MHCVLRSVPVLSYLYLAASNDEINIKFVNLPPSQFPTCPFNRDHLILMTAYITHTKLIHITHHSGKGTHHHINQRWGSPNNF